MDNATKDIKFSLELFSGCYQTTIAKMVKDVERLLVVLDKELDKPLYDDNPRFCCGDSLEAIIGTLQNLSGDISYYKEMIIAKSLAWQKFPGHILHDEGDTIDVDDWCRSAFIGGWMDRGGEVRSAARADDTPDPVMAELAAIRAELAKVPKGVPSVDCDRHEEEE